MDEEQIETAEAVPDTAEAVPTKRFFVSMLTRDINLVDAILDLVDNCLDGALRSAQGAEVNYAQHFIRIALSAEQFSISDDCGGIPRVIAKNYAFKMGREGTDKRDDETETIGMYGIGMKRAIFKMGRNSVVRSFNADDNFKVPISADWLEEPGWNPLPILDTIGDEALSVRGTTIQVVDLYPTVAQHFENAAFINDLRRSLGEHFTTFLQRGLLIEVNREKVEPVRIEVLVSEDPRGPAPYLYKKDIDGVSMSIVVGFNAGPRDGDDDDADLDFDADRSSETAGWSVFCNDRAVIVGDKSRMTGWGDGVPLYHGQFSVITGIVEFRSTLADKLPVTTTKRALDTASSVWLEAKVKMREGLRVWTTHTNTWKNHPRADQASFWASARPLDLARAIAAVSERKLTSKADGGVEYNPAKDKVLPVPPGKTPSSRRIVFSRPMEEIRAVSTYLFDKEDEKPGVVGDRCFEMVRVKAMPSGGDAE